VSFRHEFRHLYQDLFGEETGHAFADTKDEKEDDAMNAENRIRKKEGLPKRTFY